jgi:Fe-S cluster assembly protein SufD
MKVLHSGEIFETVLLNEPAVDLHILQEAGSHVKIHVINMSPSAAGRQPSDISNKISIEQAGEGCTTEIYALAYLQGSDRVTTETLVKHAVGGGTSKQLVKFVLEDQSRGRFIGDLKIIQDAQQTEAHQTNRNLLLSETAEMRTQPQLEIYADDVKATHGASTGQLDESALFYMQQRGIGVQKARQLLVGAFMREVIDTIGDSYSAIRENLLDTIDGVIE